MFRTLIQMLPEIKVQALTTYFVSASFFLSLASYSSAQNLSRFFVEMAPIRVEIVELLNGGETELIREITLPSSSISNSQSPTDDSNQAFDLNLSIEQYQQSINNLELIHGPYENQLGQELEAIGSLYHSNAEYAAAIEAFSRAVHISRVNNGLFTPLQITAVNKLILSHIASGNLEDANTQQEYLYYLKREIYGSSSPEQLLALLDFAQWNLLAADMLMGINSSNSTIFNSFTSTSLSTAERNEFIVLRLSYASQLFSELVRMIGINYGLSDSRILSYNNKLIYINYFLGTVYSAISYANSSSDIFADSPRVFETQSSFEDFSALSNTQGYRVGLNALQRNIFIIKRMASQPNEILARALIDLGDWYLIFNKRRTAIDTYASAYEELLAADAPVEIINELFQPLLPTSIPTFLPNNYSNIFINIESDEPASQGYLDAELLITQYGLLRKMDILDQSNGFPPELTRVLEARLKRSRFRPRFINGSVINSDHLPLRFKASYQ